MHARRSDLPELTLGHRLQKRDPSHCPEHIDLSLANVRLGPPGVIDHPLQLVEVTLDLGVQLLGQGAQFAQVDLVTDGEDVAELVLATGLAFRGDDFDSVPTGITASSVLWP